MDKSFRSRGFFLAIIILSSAWADETHREFISVVDDGLIPGSVLQQFLESANAYRYQVITIDADWLRNFIRRDSDVPDAEARMPLRFTTFDREEFELYGRLVDEYYEGTESGFARWAGISQGEKPFSALFVISPDNSVSATVGSLTAGFRITSLDYPPYHILWQGGPNNEIEID